MQEDDLTFLPFLLEEDIYLIESADIHLAKPTVDSSAIDSKPIQTATPILPKIEVPKQEIPIPPLPKIEIKVREPEKTEPAIAKPEVAKSTQPSQNQTIQKKVIIMVGYQSFPTVPPNVQEALEKIFSALAIDLKSVEIINVLASNPPKIENYSFEYLILMGGNGKNLAFMQNFSGTRNRYDIAKHAGKTIFFAESMDIYFKDLELKKKFWNKLKEVFGK